MLPNHRRPSTKAFAPLAVAAMAAAILGLGAAPAVAQTRVFVSGSGSDANPCSLAAPCRSFQQAHNTVAAGGEIVALDAAGYGTLNITKALTITAIGIEASVTSSSASPAITIGAGANDQVTLRGLTLFAGAISGDGIDVNSAKSVTIRDCSLSGFHGDGIYVDPSANLNLNLRGVAVDSTANHGLEISPSGSGKVTVLVSESTFTENNGFGVVLDAEASTGTIRVTLNVVAEANVGSGIYVISSAGKAQPVVMVTGSTVVNNGGGLSANGPVQVFVDRTQISGNISTGWQANGGAAVTSYTNNAVNGNGGDALNGVVQISSE